MKCTSLSYAFFPPNAAVFGQKKVEISPHLSVSSKEELFQSILSPSLTIARQGKMENFLGSVYGPILFFSRFARGKKQEKLVSVAKGKLTRMSFCLAKTLGWFEHMAKEKW